MWNNAGMRAKYIEGEKENPGLDGSAVIWLIPSKGIVLDGVEQKLQRAKNTCKQWPHSHVVEISPYVC